MVLESASTSWQGRDRGSRRVKRSSALASTEIVRSDRRNGRTPMVRTAWDSKQPSREKRRGKQACESTRYQESRQITSLQASGTRDAKGAEICLGVPQTHPGRPPSDTRAKLTIPLSVKTSCVMFPLLGPPFHFQSPSEGFTAEPRDRRFSWRRYPAPAKRVSPRPASNFGRKTPQRANQRRWDGGPAGPRTMPKEKGGLCSTGRLGQGGILRARDDERWKPDGGSRHSNARVRITASCGSAGPVPGQNDISAQGRC